MSRHGRWSDGIVISLVAAGIVSCGHPRRPPLPPERLKQLFYVSLAYPTAAPGRSAVVLNGKSGAETLYVADSEVVSLAHVQSVSYTAIEGHHVLAFLLTPEGRQSMASATAQHVGGRMAMFVDGKIHSAPVVPSPIPNGEFYLWGGVLSDEELRQLAQRFRGALGY